MERHISVVIPNYNMAATIGLCLEAVFASDYENFEAVVVDDCSDDNSVDIINKFPCTLVRMEKRSGTSTARNTGASHSRGDVLFFTDADCILERGTLSCVNRSLTGKGPDVIIGGTYSRMSFDKTFFSIFQAVFVNYSETKNVGSPDYIAAHAMIVNAGTFRESGGFPESFLPIIEDVEFSHRMRRSGCRLVVDPEIEVRHIFNFTLLKSLCNAVRKTTYWNIYSLQNKNLFTDSGSASTELKMNVLSFFVIFSLLVLYMLLHEAVFLYPLPVITIMNLFVNRGLISAFRETGGSVFAIKATLYYVVLYPVPIGIGTIKGFMKYFSNRTDWQ